MSPSSLLNATRLCLLLAVSAPTAAAAAPSLAELASLASSVYLIGAANYAPPAGFEPLKLAPRDATHGFQAGAYVKTSSGEVIVSFCGTKADALDVAADRAIAKMGLAARAIQTFRSTVAWLKEAAFKINTKRDDFTYQVLGAKLAAADHFFQESVQLALQRLPGFSRAKLYVTGHSLGGFLAQMVGAREKVETHTFNAAGGARRLLPADLRGDTITNHRRAWDLVSGSTLGMAGAHAGKVCEYASATKLPKGLRRLDQLGAHGITDFIKLLESGARPKRCK